MSVNDPTVIARLLDQAHTIAVVGLSSDPLRPSYGVAAYLQHHGYRVIPINPNETEVLGEKAYPDLASVPDRIDLVNIFRRPSEVLPHVLEAINVGAPAIWLQLDVINPRAVQRALAAGLDVVEDRCIAVEHRRWRTARQAQTKERS